MPRKSKNTQCLWVYISDETLESLRKLSTSEGKSMSEYVRTLVEDEVWASDHIVHSASIQGFVNGEQI